MQIVIDISDDDYRKVQDGRASVSMMRKAIRNGAPLPKGHGDLIDADALMKDYGNPDVKILLDNMDIIIEADKAEGSDKE